jgi:hypothetical protein
MRAPNNTNLILLRKEVALNHFLLFLVAIKYCTKMNTFFYRERVGGLLFFLFSFFLLLFLLFFFLLLLLFFFFFFSSSSLVSLSSSMIEFDFIIN